MTYALAVRARVLRANLRATVVGFLAGAAVLAVLFWLVGTGEVLSAVARADGELVALVGLAILAWVVCWGLALRSVLLALDAPLSAADAVLVYGAASFANHVTPFGQVGGEPVTAWFIAETADVEYERGLAAIASLDAINVVPSLTLVLLGLGYHATLVALSGWLRWLAWSVVGLAVVAAAGSALAWRYRETLGRGTVAGLTPVLQWLLGLVPGSGMPARADVAERVGGFLDAIGRVATDRRQLAESLAFSAAGWGVQAVGLWLALQALGASIPVYVPFFVVPLGTMASVLPTPGGLGGIEAVNVSVLVVVTAVPPATLAAAVTIHSVGGFLLTTTVGAAAATVLRVRGRTPAME